jgi:type II secretory pathway predicted ATPase ExeA
MYEKHFGLKSRPFGAKAAGAGVFVGPQQARIMTSVAKGLGASDAVVIVTGPVGVGKSTIVGRALESISPGRMVAWVGRMHLAPDEMLELLLTGFGVNRQIKGTVQRFAAFRRLLAERAAAGAQVAIVVEDAHRIGVDALVELEALTAADTGDSTSANIILIGRPDLAKLLSLPDLDRMRQRARLRQQVTPFARSCAPAAGSSWPGRPAPG